MNNENNFAIIEDNSGKYFSSNGCYYDDWGEATCPYNAPEDGCPTYCDHLD